MHCTLLCQYMADQNKQAVGEDKWKQQQGASHMLGTPYVDKYNIYIIYTKPIRTMQLSQKAAWKVFFQASRDIVKVCRMQHQ